MLDWSLTLTTRWPDAKLSPNTRGHWSKKASANKTALLEIRSLLPKDTSIPKGHLRVEFSFYQPDLRRRDLDNLLASMKPYIDAIFLLGKADDTQIQSIACHKILPDGVPRVELKIFLVSMSKYTIQDIYDVLDAMSETGNGPYIGDCWGNSKKASLGFSQERRNEYCQLILDELGKIGGKSP